MHFFPLSIYMENDTEAKNKKLLKLYFLIFVELAQNL